MKQTFVVPIYRNDPNKYITHVVRSPLNSKRIARVYVQSMDVDALFSDDDVIGISIEDRIVLPNIFSINSICASYYGLYLLPSTKAISINSECSGSKITISYKTMVSNFAVVFECDDEPLKEGFVYNLHNIVLSYNDRFRCGLEDRYSLVPFNISLENSPISIVVRPVIIGKGSLVNNYYVFKQTYLKRVGTNEHYCTFYDYLQKSLLTIYSGTGRPLLKDIHAAILNPYGKILINDAEMIIKSDSTNLSGQLQFYKTQINNLYQDPPYNRPFESAGYQLIIKTLPK